MSIVRSLLKFMGQRNLVMINPDETVYEALSVLAENKIGSLVVGSWGKISGIFTERDYARKVELAGKTAVGTLVKDVMTPEKELITVTPMTTLEECMELMYKHHIRHLPVKENGHIVDIISIRDVTDGIVRHHKFLSEELQSYISQPG